MGDPKLSPLAVAVLELVLESPKHPYEIRQHITDRGIGEVIQVKSASLYSTVDRLRKQELLEEVETSREGRRPERTVYRVTQRGKDLLFETLRTILSEPQREYPVFGAALAFLGVFPADEAVRLLQWRLVRLEAAIASDEATISGIARTGIPRLFTVEAEYTLALKRAEAGAVKTWIEAVETNELVWPQETTGLHQERGQHDQ